MLRVSGFARSSDKFISRPQWGGFFASFAFSFSAKYLDVTRWCHPFVSFWHKAMAIGETPMAATETVALPAVAADLHRSAKVDAV